MTEITRVSKEIAGRTLSLEFGKLGKQANATVVATYGETMVLAAATMSKDAKEGQDFFPLTVDYRESMGAAGKFPGGFFKREGRPSDKETLTSRCIDRPIRPLFPENFTNEVQVLLKVLSFDGDNDADIVGMIAAFAALQISDIPFAGNIGAVRIGRVDNQLIVNPVVAEIEKSTLNLTIAGTRTAIMMVEGGAKEESEAVILDAFDLALQVLGQVIDLIDELQQKCGKPKLEVPPIEVDQALAARVRELAADKIGPADLIPDKHERQTALDAILDETTAQILAEFEQTLQELLGKESPTPEETESIEALKAKIAKAPKQIKGLFYDLEKEIMRNRILNERQRSDGRKPNEIRPITCELGLLPRSHGSALFTRGQTQALVYTTLGTIEDEQKIDGILPDYYKKFMLHYNFPPFCVGETRPMRGPGRREIGHGALAERALSVVLPSHDDFPYTIRVVSEILESNGSSSMASVCGGSLALMEAGVPVKASVAGIAMGLIKEGDRYAVLSDILGVEDHLGDMDFKVTGTRNGITAFQMDLKIEGISRAIMAEALEQARVGRLHILDIMDQTIPRPRESISPYAPRIIMISIPIEKIRDVIGPGGKMIRKIISETGAKIDIDDDGRVVIASIGEEPGLKAKAWIETLTEEVEVGKIYKGKVTRIMNFGAFVEVLPGQEGLVHISELSEHRVNYVEDVVAEGDEFEVKVIEIDEIGRINLSKKAADRELGRITGEERGQRGDRGDRGDRGGRGGRGGGGGGGRDRRGGGGGGRSRNR